MTSIWKGDGGGGSLKFCHMSTDSFVFKQKTYRSFLRMEGGGSQNWSLFVVVTNVWPLNGLKLQPI